MTSPHPGRTTVPGSVGERVGGRGLLDRARLGRAAPQRWRSVRLASLTTELPTVVRTTADVEDALRPLYARLGFKPGWVAAVTGIHARRLWAPGVSATEAAAVAAQRALARADLPPAEVGALVSCSVSKPRLEPSLASELMMRVGVAPGAMGFDVGNACLGFMTGLATVANLIELGQIAVGVVVTGEDATAPLEATIRRLRAPDADIHTFKQHLATLTLGSAAAAAVLVHEDLAPSAPRVHVSTTLSAPEHHMLCVGDLDGMVTDAVALLREGVSLAGRTFAELREATGWAPAEIQTFALHQVGKAHHEAVIRRLGLPADRAPATYAELGNIGSAGVPVALAQAVEAGAMRHGGHAALLGIGSGLACQMVGVTW